MVSTAALKVWTGLTPPGDDRLDFQGEMRVPIAPAIRPTTKGVRVLVEDAAGEAMFDATLPGGPPWKEKHSGTTWVYRGGHGPSGVVKVSIRSFRRQPGRLKFLVQARKESFSLSPARLPLKGTLVIDAPLATTGQCGETPFAGSGGRCVINASWSSVKCR